MKHELERDAHARLVGWLRDVAPMLWNVGCIEGEGFPYIVSHSAGRRVGKGLGWAKQQGLRPGIPDIQIPIPRGDFHGLWIELKREDESKARVSAAQKAWLGWLNLSGQCARVCYGADSGIETVKKYMNGRME